MRQMVRRNLDRECDRNDIREHVWIEFLRQVAAHIFPEDEIRQRAEAIWRARGSPSGSPEDDWYRAEQQLRSESILDPLEIIDSVLDKGRTFFALPGLELPSEGFPSLYRYMRMSDFVRHNLKGVYLPTEVHATGIDNRCQGRVATWINAGIIGGSSLVGSFGRPDYPVWCTDHSLLPMHNANEIRDTLGLKHVEDGFLLEIAYPADSLGRRSDSLRAPTFLDACANGAGNWIFIKNRNASNEPGWGYTARLTDRKVIEEGAPEAVHKHFEVDTLDAAAIQLKAVGPITCSPPQIDYGLTLGTTTV